jgi:APA family basic amino acid/polyamine antiporter
VAAIVVLTFVNQLGVKEGAWVQNGLTLLKVAGFAAFVVAGVRAASPAASPVLAPLPAHFLSGFGIAMIAALWTYDGWYGLVFNAGEVKDPARNLPRGIILGNVAIVVLYVLINVVYVRTLSVEAIAASPRVGETAAAALFGPVGARLFAAAVVVSTFGCLSSTILYSSRIYQPMAADGVFFRALAEVHPRWRTPVRSLWAQSAVAVVLTVSGTYDQLYTYVVFIAVLFHVAAGLALFVLRWTRPDVPRPYRVWGYPIVPIVFLASSMVLLVNTLVQRPVQSLLGLFLLVLGVPAYVYWRRRAR